jgi:Tol biopolymer transport system component
MPKLRRQRCVAPALLAGVAAAVMASGASAQYFGGNKVRYEDPKFRILSSEHFDVYTYPEEDSGAKDAAVLMERWNQRLSDILGHELKGRQALILYAGHPHFRQTNATPGEIGEGTGGFTEMFKRRIVLPMAGAGHETDHVLGHELVHAFQFDIARKLAEDPSGKTSKASAMRLPLWFIEGMAEYLSVGTASPLTAMWVRDGVLRDDLPTIDDLNNPKYFPYRWGHAFWAYVAGRYGDAVVGKMLRAAVAGRDIGKAIRLELKTDTKQLSKDWHEALKAEFGPSVAAAKPVTEYGRVLVKANKKKGRINLSPVLSPDGKRMLFFSEREQFSIELYVMDVDSGEVLRTLTRSVTDPHIDSLQFLYTSGTWSPDGRQVALGGVGEGRPVLRIIDAESGDQVLEQRFPDLVEMLHPAWSPDGKSIAFAGNKAGLLQLQLFDLATKTVRPLTQGPHAAMQPAWSPDGKSIVFVTDEFTSNAAQLTYGDYRIAWLNLATGAVTPVPSLRGGKNINPQWSADGKHIYFLSDARGVANLYRTSIADGGIEEMTDLKVGIGGIAATSPALSISSQGEGRIAVSTFSKGRYSIYLLDKLQPHAVPAVIAGRAGELPPRQRVEPKIDRLLADHTPPTEAVTLAELKPYSPSLSVDFATQINAAVGNSSLGSTVGGGVALYWSDMLGDHQLLTLLQAEGDSDTFSRNLAAVVNYENREQRLRWGAAVGQVPSIYLEVTPPASNNDGTYSQFLIRHWQINREVAGRLAYPLTRADRIEASAGYRHISFVSDAVEHVYADGSNQFLGTRVIDQPSDPSIEMFPAGVALVHDTAVWGGAGPAFGTRYRVELGGVVGDLDFYTPLVDFRHYILPIPYLTLAGRLMHYGRYGRDADDSRLGPVFLGNWGLVRGYDYYSFSVSECDPAAAPDCPALDDLFGSRMMLAQAEARVPIFGARGLIPTPSVPPIEVAAFYDAGVAWDRNSEPNFTGGDRDPVEGIGYAVRLNLFGALTLSWNYVKPLDRPLQDWYWEFTIAPAF